MWQRGLRQDPASFLLLPTGHDKNKGTLVRKRRRRVATRILMRKKTESNGRRRKRLMTRTRPLKMRRKRNVLVRTRNDGLPICGSR